MVGQITLRVWRDNVTYRLDCMIVDNKNICPILGRKACIGMNIVKYTDNDAINKLTTGNASVYSVEDNLIGMSKESLIKKFPEVFAEEVWQLDGKYHTKIDPTVSPVQHPPCRVPMSVRKQLKSELRHLTEHEILAPVTAPMPWVSSLVVIPKKDGRLRLCLDPKDLNQAIQREHYPLPTMEDVATRVAKVFAELDVRNGFWHVKLDDSSCDLTTFNTPFGRYWWKHMPFGIRSAPEVFQQRMH